MGPKDKSTLNFAAYFHVELCEATDLNLLVYMYNVKARWVMRERVACFLDRIGVQITPELTFLRTAWPSPRRDRLPDPNPHPNPNHGSIKTPMRPKKHAVRSCLQVCVQSWPCRRNRVLPPRVRILHPVFSTTNHYPVLLALKFRLRQQLRETSTQHTSYS